MIEIVAAYDKNRGIGVDNDLLWQRDLPADLARFKELTMGKSIVMGRKTFESIGRPLPGRQNIVVSHSAVDVNGVTGASSLADAYEIASNEIAIIGGGSIYEQALKDADIVHATEVNAEFPHATVFFPPLGSDWHEVTREHHEADDKNKYSFDFVTYQKS